MDVSLFLFYAGVLEISALSAVGSVTGGEQVKLLHTKACAVAATGLSCVMGISEGSVSGVFKVIILAGR